MKTFESDSKETEKITIMPNAAAATINMVLKLIDIFLSDIFLSSLNC